MQQLHIGKRDPNVPFNEKVIDYRGGDKSWNLEWKHFIDVLNNNTPLIGSGLDGAIASCIVEKAYLSSRECRRVSLGEENNE